jgi:sulfite exporter TauE/SafE
MGELLQRKTNSNLFFLGVLNGLLPCALVLVAFGIAVTQGSVLNGVIFMLSYGLGTVPGISLVAFLGGRMLQQIPWKVRRIAPLAFSLIALVMIVRGLNLGIPYLSPKMEQTNQLTEARKMPHQVICK